MSLDDGEFLVKIQIKVATMTVFERKKLLDESEKSCATRGTMSGMSGVLVWVACYCG